MLQMADYAIQGTDSDGDLSSQSWYWGNLDREEANRILMAKSHGHFLVRDSNTSGEYTLVVRRKERISNIRILRGANGGFGVVSNRCDFGDVADLVLYLMEHPRFLHHHYANTDLLHPISKPESVSEAETHDLLHQLVMRNKDLIQHNHLYTDHVNHWKLTLQEIEGSKSRINSLRVVMSLFEGQLALLNEELSTGLMKPSSEDGPKLDESAGVMSNWSLVKQRLRLMQERVGQEEAMERRLKTQALGQQEELHRMRGTLSQIQQEVTFLRLRVEERGLVKDYLDNLLRDDKDTDLSHYDPKNWRVHCDRQEAERILGQRVPGTFLVRPGRDGGHALSINIASLGEEGRDAETRHCLIQQDPRSFQYGFHPDYCIFGCLEELVRKHQTISLSYYNARLDVCLTYPVHYRRSRLEQEER